MEKNEIRLLTKEKISDSNVMLDMVCEDEELSEAQLTALKKQDDECRRVSQLLDKLHKTHNIIEKGQCVYGLVPKEINSSPGNSPAVELPNNLPNVPDLAIITHQFSSNTSQIPIPPRLLQNQPSGTVQTVRNPSNAYQAVMEYRLGHIVRVVSSAQHISGTPIIQGTVIMEKSAQPTAQPVMINGKLYPSLMVLMKPLLQTKEYTTSVITRMREELDEELKNVFLFPPNKLTEWLMRRGLIHAEQKCRVHLDSKYRPVPFTLEVHSDSSKFPNSGGYVWVADCCDQRYLSVFSGSIFVGVSYTPMRILMLIYHWACQTNPLCTSIRMEVDMNYIKRFNSSMRAVCISAVNEKLKQIGGEKREIEVAIVTIAADCSEGNPKKIKVDILGVLDLENHMVRLRALEPVKAAVGTLTVKKRDYRQILAPLVLWVDQRSTIVTDLSIDESNLNDLGFLSVRRIPKAKGKSKLRILDYLSTSIPSNFQNVLPMMNRVLVQQFLDEISWREYFGPSPKQAFKNIVIHMSEITEIQSEQTLMDTLKHISRDPFQNWEYKNICKKQPKVVVVPNSTAPTNNFISLNSLAENEASFPKVNRLPKHIRKVNSPSERIRKRMPGYDVSDPRDVWQPLPKMSRQHNVLLDSFYGRIKGRSKEDLERDEANWRANPANSSCLNFQCCACQRLFNNNLLFMRHLMRHTQNKRAVDATDDPPVCKYCLKSFSNDHTLETHVKFTHMVRNGPLTCRICNMEFFTTVKFVEHMHSMHVEFELPYSCKVCGFRSSVHQDVVEHFHQDHSGSRKLQCPICLQVVTGIGELAKRNVILFFQHIQKHFVQSPTLICQKCILRFTTHENVTDHLLNDHLSCKGKPGLTRLLFKRRSTTTPVPETDSEVPVPEVTLEVPTPEMAPEVPTPEMAPEVPTPEMALEVPTPEMAPEVPTPEMAPEVPTSEMAPEIPTPEMAPEIPTPEMALEVPTPEMAPEVPIPEMALEVPTPETVPEVPSPISKPVIPEPKIPLPSNHNPIPVSADVNVKVKLESNEEASLLATVDFSSLVGIPREEIKINKDISSVPHKCVECKRDILQEKHYLSNITCTYCPYVTCCSNAIRSHITKFHSTGKECRRRLRSSNEIKIEGGRKHPMSAPLYCICGFRNSSGDVLAQHMVRRKCRTVYTYLEGNRDLESRSASFPRLMTRTEPVDKDPSDQTIKSYAEEMVQSSVSSPSTGNALPEKSSGKPQSMHNSLGMVKKPSTVESSNDVPDLNDKGDLKMKVLRITKSHSKWKIG